MLGDWGSSSDLKSQACHENLERHSVAPLLNLFPQKSDVLLALLLPPVSMQILLHVVFDVGEQGLLATHKKNRQLLQPGRGKADLLLKQPFARAGVYGHFSCSSFPYSTAACETACQGCLPGRRLEPTLGQDKCRRIFCTNAYVAAAFKSQDGKVGDNSSWLAKKCLRWQTCPQVPIS